MRRIEEEYVKPGKVLLTYKYFPMLGRSSDADIVLGEIRIHIGKSESDWAAYAAECAHEQGKFWEYRDKLFSMFVDVDAGTYRKPNLKKYAAELGLDTTTFDRCLDAEKYASVIQADIAEAKRLGIDGVPAVVINGILLRPATTDFSKIAQAIDAALK